jgi:imidazolonepropionase-like amidohydrolase
VLTISHPLFPISPSRDATMILSVLLAAALARHPAAGDTTRYVVMMGGRAAGGAAAWAEPDGELRYTYEYNDRGRGPRLETRLRVGPGGGVTRMETTGVDYYKNPVAETFTLEGGTARWKNTSEQGETAVRGPAMYAPIQTAADFGVFARAMLAAGGRIALLPEGEAAIERAGELQVSSNGRTRTVVQYLVNGFGFEPYPIWLTPEGRFFASGAEWQATVEAGWEGALPALFAAQTETEARRSATLARTLARRPATPLIFRHVGVFDAVAKVVRSDQAVVVTGNRITAAGPDATVQAPAGAEVIDGRGKTLLPGLWDMHTHLGGTDGLLHIAAGVTSARDLGNDTTTLLELRRKWDSGEAVGPRVVMAGFIDGPGPFTGPTGIKVATAGEARAAVDAYARLGYEQIKVYSSLDPALLPVIIRRAHEEGLRVSGHIPWPLHADSAVKLGVDELQHANFLLLNFLGDSVDTRTPARFTVPARMAAELDLASPRVQAFIRLLKERDIVVDPTLTAFEGLFTARQGEVEPSFAPVADRMPAAVRRSLRGGGLPVPEGMDARYRASYGRMVEIVGALHRAGVRLVPGTDGLAGFALHREFELWVRAGIPPADVLYAATLGSARVTKRDDRLGTVAAGKLADLVLVDGDPTRNISDIRRTRLVVKDGVVYQPDAVFAAIGVGPVPAGR